MTTQGIMLPSWILVLAVSATLVEAAPMGAGPRGTNAGNPGMQSHLQQAQRYNGSGAGGSGGFAAMRHGGSEARAVRIFGALDSDGNDIITLDEFLARPMERASFRFDLFDTDDDGLISRDEFNIAHTPPLQDTDIDIDALHACIADNLSGDLYQPDPDARFDEFDSNGDGFIDPDEFSTARTAHATDKFNLLDVDADNALSQLELEGALQYMSERRAIRRNCIEEQRDINELLAD